MVDGGPLFHEQVADPESAKAAEQSGRLGEDQKVQEQFDSFAQDARRPG